MIESKYPEELNLVNTFIMFVFTIYEQVYGSNMIVGFIFAMLKSINQSGHRNRIVTSELVVEDAMKITV